MIKKVEDGCELSESEKTRVVTLEDGDYVCSDEVGQPIRLPTSLLLWHKTS